MEKRSNKKTMATIGSAVYFFISLYGAIKIPTMIPQILGSLVILIGILYGIKTAGGVFSQRAGDKKNNPEG